MRTQNPVHLEAKLMARYKNTERKQIIMIQTALDEQLLPGTIEYGLDRIVDSLDLESFDDHFRNDHLGACAYPPSVLLKVILFAYSRGIFSSRRIAECCEKHIVFIALSGGLTPDFSTIAKFISTMSPAIEKIFAQVLEQCINAKLLGGELLAIDGCKLASNASREYSGTFADLENKRNKFVYRAKLLMRLHKRSDTKERKLELKRSSKHLRKKADKVDAFLKENKPKPGARYGERQSNVTDNESAKIKTSHGMIQGYNGIGLVDAKHQIVVYGEAFGTGQEYDTLKPVIESAKRILRQPLQNAKLLADTNYFKEANLKYLSEEGINAYIPDQGFRARDARFKNRERFKSRIVDLSIRKKRSQFTLEDFEYQSENDYYICPNNKILRRWGDPRWVKEIT